MGERKTQGPKGLWRIQLVGVVKEGEAPEIGKVVEESDQRPEHGGPDPGEGPDDQGEQTDPPQFRLLLVQARPASGFDEIEHAFRFDHDRGDLRLRCAFI